MKKVLSPAAQSVLDAAGASEPGIYATITAALRAAADQLREAYANEEYVDSADDWLDDIATELENHQ
jgi:hypothetical protein